MNSWRILQKICPFILLVLQGVHSDNITPYFNCPNMPTNLNKVIATVYLNGENMIEGEKNSSFSAFTKICSRKFSPDVVSITLKIGANVKCNPDNTCTCKSSWEQTDCTVAFKNACLSRNLDQATLLNFFCCQTKPNMTFEKCFKETHLDMGKIKHCVDYKTGQTTAIMNSEEVEAYNIPSEYSEPYALFGEPPAYDTCMDDMAYRYWPKLMCAMLKTEVSGKLEECKHL